MRDSSPSSILPPPGEVNVLPGRVVRVAGGAATLTGLSWNSEGHVALSLAGEGVRLVADASELVALADLCAAIARELVQRDGGEAAAVPALPPAGQALEVPFNDTVLEDVADGAGKPRTAVSISRPGALVLMAGGRGLRLTFRDRGDVAQLVAALELVDAHLASIADTAGEAVARLIGAEAAGHA